MIRPQGEAPAAPCNKARIGRRASLYRIVQPNRDAIPPGDQYIAYMGPEEQADIISYGVNLWALIYCQYIVLIVIGLYQFQPLAAIQESG